MKEKAFYGRLEFRRHFPGASLLLRYRNSRPFMKKEQEAFGIPFRNPLGLTGMDPKGLYFNQLSDYGFGYVSIGPFTSGDRNALLPLIREIRSAPVRTVLSASLCRDSSHTSEEEILEDYRIPFSLLYDFVDFFIVDMYAPEAESIMDILDELLNLRLCYEKHTPILLRVPRKIQDSDLAAIVDFALLSGIEGIVIAGVEGVHSVRQRSNGRIDIVGTLSEGTPEEAESLLAHGANLLDIHGNLPDLGLHVPRAIMHHLSTRAAL